MNYLSLWIATVVASGLVGAFLYCLGEYRGIKLEHQRVTKIIKGYSDKLDKEYPDTFDAEVKIPFHVRIGVRMIEDQIVS